VRQELTAEEVIAAQLERRLGSLPLGTRLTLMLEQLILDHTGRPLPGSHPVGWVLRHTPGGVQIRLLSLHRARPDGPGVVGGGAPRRRAVARLPADGQAHVTSAVGVSRTGSRSWRWRAGSHPWPGPSPHPACVGA
jgi:hypothetical protein